MRKHNLHYFSYGILLLSFLIYLGNTYRVSVERWDDAYITFRYAQNLAHGQGLVWNAGGEPVEGFTSLLHVLLLALGIRVGINPELGGLIIGLGAVIGSLAMMVFLLRRLCGAVHPAAAVILGLYLIDNNTAIHTTSGLETQLFVFLLCAGYATALSFLESPKWVTSVLLGAWVFLSVLCRPEAVVYGGGLVGVLAIFAFRNRLPRNAKLSILLKLGLTGGLVLVLGLTYAAWNLYYFGYVLPNPYYVKSAHISLAGWKYVLYYLAHIAVWFGPVTAALFWFTSSESGRAISTREMFGIIWARLHSVFRPEDRRVMFIATLTPPVLALAYYLTIIHETGGAHRFSYPTSFYLVTAAATLISLSLDGLRVRTAQWWKFGAVVAMCLVAFVLYQGSWRVEAASYSDFFEYHHKIASALRATGLGSKGTILCDAAGVIPYVSGFNQIDRVGLNDNFLSGRKAVSVEERETYMWSRGADVYVGYEPAATFGTESANLEPRMRTPYVLHSLLERRSNGIEDRIFLRDPKQLYARMKELRDHWELVGELSWPGWRIWKLKSFIYVRKASPYAKVLLTRLRAIVDVGPERVNLNDAG